MARKAVAIIADYDGCFDIISPSNLRGSKMDKMFEFAEQMDKLFHRRVFAEQLLLGFLDEITADASDVILFSGSSRQTPESDQCNATLNDNGESIAGLRQLAQEKGWVFDPSLLGRNSAQCIFWMKKEIVERHCRKLGGTGIEVVVYFFDDIEKYLNHVREHARLPSDVHLETVLFDWYGICIDGTQDPPLSAVIRSFTRQRRNDRDLPRAEGWQGSWHDARDVHDPAEVVAH
eukprot:7684426-Karenia_brevis.AAC.1